MHAVPGDAADRAAPADDRFNGFINGTDWDAERWEGYETDALTRYGFEFMDQCGDESFCLCLSPHQPHFTPFEWAPEESYDRLPAELTPPENVHDDKPEEAVRMYRHYLAMTLALDDMVGQVTDYLERSGLADNTLVVFTSDHGSQFGAHIGYPFMKKQPYEESVNVPCIMRLPGVFDGGLRRDTLTAPVDFFPSLCALCGVPIPRSVEGHDLSAAWRGEPGAFEQDALLTMSFSAKYDWFADGAEWRGVRTKTHAYARRLSGEVELYDLVSDPLQMTNLADSPDHAGLREELEATMCSLQTVRGDELVPCTAWKQWLDAQRRVVRNAFGPLSHPESEPDWSLLA